MWQGWEHKREAPSFYYHESEKPVGCNSMCLALQMLIWAEDTGPGLPAA